MPIDIPKVIGGEELLAKRSAVDAAGDFRATLINGVVFRDPHAPFLTRMAILRKSRATAGGSWGSPSFRFTLRRRYLAEHAPGASTNAAWIGYSSSRGRSRSWCSTGETIRRPAARSTFLRSAKGNATGRIPVVMVQAGDPVGSGLVTTLARPGGNVTRG
jgi:hypothetical protein